MLIAGIAPNVKRLTKWMTITKKELLDEDGKAPVDQYEWPFVCIPIIPTNTIYVYVYTM